MTVFRAGQIESGKLPPYISICSRSSRGIVNGSSPPPPRVTSRGPIFRN